MVKFCIDVTSQAQLDEALARSSARDQVPVVLVDFWAPWCGPCVNFAPTLEELATTYKERVVVLKVNCDELNDVAAKYRICSLPTFIAFARGQEFESVRGASRNAVVGLLDRAIDNSPFSPQPLPVATPAPGAAPATKPSMATAR